MRIYLFIYLFIFNLPEGPSSSSQENCAFLL